MQATKNNQSTQTGVKKFSSPKRTPTRHSAAKDFSVWRQACFIMAPKTGSKKTSRNMAAIKRPRLYCHFCRASCRTGNGFHSQREHIIFLQAELLRLFLCSVAVFLWSAPVAFRRVTLETPKWTSRIRTTTGSLSALARPTPYQLSRRVASCGPWLWS